MTQPNENKPSHWTVIGGELAELGVENLQWRDPNAVHFVGTFDRWEDARDAWKANSWMKVDNALMRYFIHPVYGDKVAS